MKKQTKKSYAIGCVVALTIVATQLSYSECWDVGSGTRKCGQDSGPVPKGCIKVTCPSEDTCVDNGTEYGTCVLYYEYKDCQKDWYSYDGFTGMCTTPSIPAGTVQGGYRCEVAHTTGCP